MAGAAPGLAADCALYGGGLDRLHLATGGRATRTRMSVTEKLATVGRSAPLLGVMVLSIGGIYVGAFTPGGSIRYRCCSRHHTCSCYALHQFCAFWGAVQDTLKTSAMLYAIVIGANVLNPFLAVTRIPAVLGSGLESLGLGAYGSLAVVVRAYVILGMFMDGLAMLVVTVPIVYPMMMQFGIDPIWF